MTMSVLQIVAGVAMVVLAAILFFSYRAYLAANSERRMRAMLESVGLDPEIAASGEMPTIMKEVRQRCRSCSSESVCEQWLESDKKSDNDFCPNAKVFEILNRYSEPAT